MQDGRTRKLEAAGPVEDFARFLRQNEVALVVEAGGVEGAEYVLDAERVAIGRGPGVDLAFGDDAMSRSHAVLEFAGGGFRVRDLGSTNGVAVNGQRVEVAELEHGDSLQVGEHRFRFLHEARPSSAPTHHLAEA